MQHVGCTTTTDKYPGTTSVLTQYATAIPRAMRCYSMQNLEQVGEYEAQKAECSATSTSDIANQPAGQQSVRAASHKGQCMYIITFWILAGKCLVYLFYLKQCHQALYQDPVTNAAYARLTNVIVIILWKLAQNAAGLHAENVSLLICAYYRLILSAL